MSVVQLEQARVHYEDVTALNGLSLELEEGEVLGLFGHNGAGKTTTMKLILGLLKPSQGTVSVFGQTPTSSSFNDCRYRLGFLPENVSFYQQLTGREVLSYFANLKRVDKSRVQQLLDQVGLAEAANRRVKTYSKGMRQRLGLAQALLAHPRLLLLDEPTVGLDPIATQDFYATVEQLRKSGSSVVLCSHVLPGVEKYIDRAVILGQGECKALGTLQELRQQTHLPVIIQVKGELNTQNLKQTFSEEDMSIHTTDDKSLSISCTQTLKMGVLREVLKQPSVTDINVQVPSLEQIYHHFMHHDNDHKTASFSSTTQGEQ